MFWLLSTIFNITIFLAVMIVFEAWKFDEKVMDIKYIVCCSVYIVTSIMLTYMGFRYKREHPQHLRNYLASPNPVLNEPLLMKNQDHAIDLRAS